MPQRLIVTALILLALSATCAARQSAGEKQQPKPPGPEGREEPVKTEVFTHLPGGSIPQALLDAIKPVELPAGKDAWAVQVATRGGFTGRGRGGVMVVSDGRLVCDPPGTPCAERAAPGALRSYGMSVLGARPDKWGESRLGMCQDCYQTLLVLRRRNKDGAEEVYNAFWDDATQGDVPEEVRKIYAGALKLTAAKK